MTATEHSNKSTAATTEKVSFGAGCFWQIEAAFRQVEGVTETAVGYEGGRVPNPTYEQVCTGGTGHAEVCEITYDPDLISFGELLKIYWRIHDPTQLDRQGPDIGSQYRSVIFFQSDEQRAEAEASKEAEQARHRKPIATTIEPATGFYMAEEYHQCYLENRRGAGGLIGTLLGR
ncbi:MAG: peptide-methionine (S)-S-oxide reductase MsrA [Solirubrobacterales bacterium]|nr:MAG: peptide-methionine (S)-S-oxide reductase MsrA [Solirubrobacterales bacterium]